MLRVPLVRTAIPSSRSVLRFASTSSVRRDETKPSQLQSTMTKPVQVSYKTGSSSITLSLPSQIMDALKKSGPTSAKAKAQASKALRKEAPVTVGEVYAFATAESYDFTALRQSGRLPKDCQMFEDNELIHVPHWPENASTGAGEVFIFRSGSYVTWGVDAEQSKRFLRTVIQGRDVKHVVEQGRYREIGDEGMDCLHAPDQTTRIQGDIIVIGQAPPQGDDEWTPTLARLAFSQGLARSARLSVQESALSQFLNSVSSIPSHLERAGKVPFSRRKIIQKMGTLLRLRQKANLDRDNFYDEPEVYWENPRMEEHYRSICAELDIDSRFETLNEKLDHCENLLGVVRALLTESTAHRMELIIIGLIAFEAGIAFLSHGWMPPTLVGAWEASWAFITGADKTL